MLVEVIGFIILCILIIIICKIAFFILGAMFENCVFFKPTRKLGSRKLISDVNRLLNDVIYEANAFYSDNELSSDEAKLFIYFAKFLKKTSYKERKLMDFSEFNQLEYLSSIYILMNMLIEHKSTLEYLKNSKDEVEIKHYKDICDNLKDFIETRDGKNLLDTNTLEIIELYRSKIENKYHMESLEMLLEFINLKYSILIKSEIVLESYEAAKAYYNNLIKSAEWLKMRSYIDKSKENCINECAKTRINKLDSIMRGIERTFSTDNFNGIRFNSSISLEDIKVLYYKDIFSQQFEHFEKYGIKDEKIDMILYQSARYSFYVYYKDYCFYSYVYDLKKDFSTFLHSETYEAFGKEMPRELKRIFF